MLLRHLQQVRREIALPAGRRGSLALRHVDAGSCNGCEHELAATANPYYDLQRHGLNIVASPRHADVLLVTGPITTRMADPLRRAYEAMPEPRLVAALGDCAVGCAVGHAAGCTAGPAAGCTVGHAVLADPAQLAGPLEEILPVDLRIPGCPPNPSQIAEALLGLMHETAQHPTARRARNSSSRDTHT